jgi:hypothetical protein
MGDRMTCVTTPEMMVTHSDANHPQNVASPPPPPTGAVGGGGAPSCAVKVVPLFACNIQAIGQCNSPRIADSVGQGAPCPTLSTHKCEDAKDCESQPSKHRAAPVIQQAQLLQYD